MGTDGNREGKLPLDIHAPPAGVRDPGRVRLGCPRSDSQKKKDFSKVEFFTYDEGLCVQCLHLGLYDDEPETLARMDAFAAEQGYAVDFSDTRFHHEIYLSDPNRTLPEKRKTILRHPLKSSL